MAVSLFVKAHINFFVLFKVIRSGRTLQETWNDIFLNDLRIYRQYR